MQNPHREDKAAICSPTLFAKESNEHNTPLQPRGLGSQHWLSDSNAKYKCKAIRLIVRYNAMTKSRLLNPTGRMGFAPRGFETSASFLHRKTAEFLTSVHHIIFLKVQFLRFLHFKIALYVSLKNTVFPPYRFWRL
jgi:hypothetical protein